MKQLIAALFCLWVAGCAGEESPEKSLPLCWNVNKLGPGRFAGQGIFVTSYEGLGLQAPGCDDRGGHNTYLWHMRWDEEAKAAVARHQDPPPLTSVRRPDLLLRLLGRVP